MFACDYGLTFGLVQNTVLHEKTDDALADRPLQVCHCFQGKAGFLKSQLPGLFFTKHAGKPVSEDAAVEVAPEFAFGQCGACPPWPSSSSASQVARCVCTRR